MNTFWDLGFSQKIGTAQTESQERPREAVAAGLPAGYGGIRARNSFVILITSADLTAGYGGLR